jgi:serine/threonine protein kinase
MLSSSSICEVCRVPVDPTLGCAACLWGQALEGDGPHSAADDAPEIEGYSISGELGRGGMGVVYRVQQKNPVREVALKIVAPGSLRAKEERQRFRMEIEAMAAMTHPGILPLYETGEDDLGRPWFTMLLADGGSLAERVPTLGGDWRRIASLIAELADAIQYAHGRGILHRDLKPANVLFDSADRAYVADFGLAKWADRDASLTASTMFLLGSPAYMAPEAASGGSKAATTASDIYGLGTILYELLTNHRPYDHGTAAQILARIVAESPVPPRQRMKTIPRDLEVITQKAMARDPARRYASAAALADDLRLWLGRRPILARPVGPAERLQIWARRNPALAALSALFLTSILAAGFLLWRANQRLTASLNDLEANVDYMTSTLPERIQPLGRLDLLDDVFENVAKHYARTDARTDPASLAREAEFLTNWAQILRPRGQMTAAVERLRAAMVKARAATDGRAAPAAAIRARMNTGRRLAELLIEAKQPAEARAILDGSIAFADAASSNDLTHRILRADLAMERCFLAAEEGNPKEALDHAVTAMQMRQAYQAELEEPPSTPEKTAALRGVTVGWQALIEAHIRAGNMTAARERLGDLQVLVDRLLILLPDDPVVRYLSINRWLYVATRGADEPQAKREYYEKAEREAGLLLTRDAANVEWRMAALHAASRLETLYWEAGDEPARFAARRRVAERLEYLYSAGITDVHFLTHIRDWAAECGNKHAGDDWPAARHHYTEAIKLQRRAATLTGDKDQSDRLEKSKGRIFDKVIEHEGKEAAEKWRAEFEAKP